MTDLPLEQHHKIGKKKKKMLPPAELENWCNTFLPPGFFLKIVVLKFWRNFLKKYKM